MQVIPSGARLIRCDTLALVFEYRAPRTITVAVGNGDQLALALSGGEIVTLEVDAVKQTLVQVASATLDQDIACLSLYGADEGPPGGMSMVELGVKSTILAVGMWTDNSVRLFAAQTMQELSRTQLGVESQAQARDVALVSLGEPSSLTLYLMVGLGDGTLITFIVDFQDGLPKTTTRRRVVIGTHPISLTCFSNAGLPCVFASCDRPTVLSTRNGKLMFSVVNILEVTGMSPFHSEMFPECLALSSETGLMIGTVDEIQKLHVQTYPLGESPRRIAHCGQCGVYAGESPYVD